MESVGFKEWAVVCQAILRGAQSVIIRKGGIAEGREGFSFRHREFFLFPTWFHEQPAKVRNATDVELPNRDEAAVNIDVFARIDEIRVITSWDSALRLEPMHIWRREVVRERFDYSDQPGLHVAFIRAFRAQPRWCLPNERRYGGCRSWINLPDPPTDLQLEPVLSDEQHAAVREQFLQLTSGVARCANV